VIATRLVRADATAARLAGHVLAHDLRDPDGRIAFAKGTPLGTVDPSVLVALPWESLHVVAMGEGDVHEHEAGARLARSAAGAGVAVGAWGGGHWPMTAMHRGMLRVHLAALEAVNTIEGLCVYTLFDRQVVDAGEVVARAKIVPFILPRAVLEEGEERARAADGLVTVLPFQPRRVGALVQETLGQRAMARFEGALAEKVEWFGSSLLPPRFVPTQPDTVVAGLRGLLEDGAEVLAVAGSRAMDPLDATFEALRRIGATMVRHGVPAHPGSLFWLARVGEIPVVGMPPCGLFSQATVFDLVLPRLLAGERLEAADLASLGHGGFLTRDMSFRFPPYRHARERGAVE
jgi:hypothetical protein